MIVTPHASGQPPARESRPTAPVHWHRGRRPGPVEVKFNLNVTVTFKFPGHLNLASPADRPRQLSVGLCRR